MNNTPTIQNLLITAREQLKGLLGNVDSENRYSLLMAMNAMSIAARSLDIQSRSDVSIDTGGVDTKIWMRTAPADAVSDPALVQHLKTHVRQKLSLSNPKYKEETSQNP